MFDELLQLYQQHNWLWLGTVFIFSLMVGSFLNVVIYRVPVMLERSWRNECQILLADELKKTPHAKSEKPFNLFVPNSTCPHCKTAIKPWHNLPIIGWLMLAGKCAQCKTNIPIRYPIIELMTGLLGLFAATQLSFTSLTLWALVFTFVLICLCFIDLDTMLLPDQMTIGLLWLGLIANLNANFVPIEDAIIGAIAGYLSLWSVFQTFKLLTGKEGMGFGDFKLLAALGAWMGWQALPVIILLSSIVGAVIGIIMLKAQKKGNQHPIPFGPYLVIAGLIAFYWGDQITQFYLTHWVHA